MKCRDEACSLEATRDGSSILAAGLRKLTELSESGSGTAERLAPTPERPGPRISTVSVAVLFVVHDDILFLRQAAAAAKSAGDLFVCVSKTAWDGTIGNWEAAAKMAHELRAEVILCDKLGEAAHRRFALDEIRKRKKYQYCLIPDSDEIIEPRLLDSVLVLARAGAAEQVKVPLDTFFKGCSYVVRPRERITPTILIDLEKVEHNYIRDYRGGRTITLGPEHGVLYHLSYVGPDERIRRKIATSSHRDEISNRWWPEVWLAWDEDHALRNLHPTHPEAYGFVERIPIPEILKGCWNERPQAGDPEPIPNWPRLSVIIPLYGGENDIRACLESLLKLTDLLHEVIVVDDRSPDHAAEVAEGFIERFAEAGAKETLGKRGLAFPSGNPGGVKEISPGLSAAWRSVAEAASDTPGKPAFIPSGTPEGVPERPASRFLTGATFTLLRNTENVGFAATCNRGYAACKGEAILFLNSDTVMPRAGLVRLIETLYSEPSVGAAGPFTNNAGYHQPAPITYTDLANLDRFAQDFADKDVEDQDVPMLVGFCLAIKREVLDEGEMPFDERFKQAFFEDNDTCYRILRKGYRLRLSARAYVHHGGSKSLGRMKTYAHALLSRNKKVFLDKWQGDLETGFASHLPGQAAQNIVFRKERRPDILRRRLQKLGGKARITLAMIVKDGAKTLPACLKSAEGIFFQTVIVDTGSSDNTVEIARSFGCEVYEHPWEDSFAAARNWSLKYAKGDWVFFMDADDTLPIETAEALLNAAFSAPPEITAFIVPVQFVASAQTMGTRVDHIKLFRNLKGLKWTHRIHEQILPSLKEHGGTILRIAQPVLHSGYDSSPEGQAAKTARDAPLLLADLADNPNCPFALFNIGMTDFAHKEYEQAIPRLEACLSLSDPSDSIVRKAYVLLGQCIRSLATQGAQS